MASDKVRLYGLDWEPNTDPLRREFWMMRKGGKWKKKNGNYAGNGLLWHFKTAAKLVWPALEWHEWNELIVNEWIKHKYVGIMGPTNSGKTNTSAWMHLLWYYVFPTRSTIIICSTTRERLEDRIWGEMKKLHRQAKRLHPWLSGNLIESRQRIVYDHKTEAIDGRDFRNGIVGVPCRSGNKYVGLGDFIGIKNKHVFLCGDELQLLPASFIDSLSNLMKGPSRKCTGMGNPAETTDSLGRLCEPSMELNGWDGGIDQTPKTKTWPTRWMEGISIQLCGSDSPNNKTPPGQPPLFPFLISKLDMENDARIWGVNDWHYTMFNEGMMPRGQGHCRILTRSAAIKNHAMEPPVWANHNRTKIGFLDAAYRGLGGDRCVFGELQYGEESQGPDQISTSAIINQQNPDSPKRQILALIDQMVIPIQANQVAPTQQEAEEQIVKFCMKECENRGISPQNFFYDSGMRTTLATCFGRMWSPMVNAIDFGGTPSERKVSDNIDVLCKDYYSKFVTELWYSVRLIIDCGQFRGMTEDVLQEGCMREYKRVGENKIEVETKKEMKQKTGRSPDLFDALACGVEGARRLGFRIRSVTEIKRSVRTEAWKTDLRQQAAKLWRTGNLTHA